MRFEVGGASIDLDASDVLSRVAGQSPESIQTHWVEVQGRKWPPKQLLELVASLPRDRFISHGAIRIFRRLGFRTSELPDAAAISAGSPRDRGAPVPSVDGRDAPDLADAVRVLGDFMGAQNLTDRIALLEQKLVGVSKTTAAEVVAKAGVSTETLTAALTVRNALGRINDVIHAAVISLVLPHLLEVGEIISNRPSLAAGNDHGRPFDLETNLRIAEFKVSVWKGADAMRKRGVFTDLVHLALDESGRRAQLFVVGEQPKLFLESSRSPASWGFTRGSAKLMERYEARFGSVDVPISVVRGTHAESVEIIDLNTVLPGLSALVGAP